MKDTLKQIIPILLLMLIVAALAPRVVNADTASGECGENAFYSLDESGTLYVTGSGIVEYAGWDDYKDQIVRVEVSGPSELGEYLFQGYSNLKTAVLGDSVEVIGAFCFAAGYEDYMEIDCNLESIEFGSGIRKIENNAFKNTSTIKKVIINDLDAWGSVEIGYDGYNRTDGSPLIPGADLIYNGEPVREVTFSDSVERIGQFTFANCQSLEKVTIPASVKSIGVFAFYDTPMLSSVTFLGHAPEPDFYRYSDSIAYASGIFTYNRYIYNRQVKTLYINHPVGDDTYTNRIRTLYSSGYMVEDVPGEDPNADWRDLFLAETDNEIWTDRVRWPEPDQNLVMHGACGDDMTWTLDKAGVLTITGTGEMNSSPYMYRWQDYEDQIKKVVIQDGVTSIEDYAFDFCQNIESVDIPESVTYIGEYAFYFCNSLTEITIPEGVTTIGDEAFFGCSSLKEIEIPGSLTEIGKAAFRNCSTNMNSINVSAENQVYDSRNNCNAIIETATNTIILGGNNTNIPSTITGIGEYAFAGSNMTEITIPESVVSIEDYAFYGCSSLKEIEIPESVVSIGDGAFYGCSSLSDVYYECDISKWKSIEIGEENDNLIYHAVIHYNGETTGWQKIDNVWYYFFESGEMAIGFRKIDGVYYLFDSSGQMLTGWQKLYVNNVYKWFYFKGSGAMVTGWQKIDGTWYYFESYGAMVTGWMKVGSSWYYMYQSGAMATGWVKDGGTWYYMSASGAMTTGWVKVGNAWYYMKASGAMAANEWCEGYWLNADGSWTYKPKGSWKQDSTGWWFGDTSGWYAKNTTVKIDNVNYRFNASGYWVK